MYISLTGGPGEKKFFCPPADRSKGFKRQQVFEAQFNKKIYATYLCDMEREAI